MDGNVIIKAVLDTVDVSKNIKALERDLQGISWKNITEGDEKAAKLSSSFKKAGTAATVTLTAPVVAAGKAVFGVASDYEQANARIAAAFGVSGEEAERFSGIGKRIYEGGWGQSLDEVNDALIQCKSTLRDVSDEDLQTVTTNALMLSDTFGADVNESIRGTNALMEGFGLSATEASDLLTAGMQRGLNYTDELGDNLSEYSVRWGEAGMSASEYFSLLEAGTSNGAYNLDKVGDYLNEFLTALSDGRMEESIGSFSEGTQEVFENFKNGSATAEDMLQAVLGDLTQMPNEYDKAALASTLWSSLGEDNAMGMIESLAGVQDSFGDVAGAAQQAQEAASDSFAVKSQEAMRELQGSIEPLGEPLLNIATNVARQQKVPTIIFSLEMTCEQLTDRILSSTAGIDSQAFRTGRLNNSDWNDFANATSLLYNVPIYMDDSSGISVPEIKAKIRQINQDPKRDKIGLVIIDYLQLMQSAKRTESRVQEISDITRNLKIMAKELNVPVIALSQLSRAAEKTAGRSDHRPQLSDLRDSGSIEQDADVVLFLYRAAYYNSQNGETEQANENEAECIVAKNRHGETSVVRLGWDGAHTRFSNLDEIHEQY